MPEERARQAIESLALAMEKMRELRASMDRLFRAVVFLSVIVAVFLLGFLPWYVITRDDTAQENRKSVCTLAESMTNALIGASASGPAEQRQAQIDSFEIDLEHRLASIDCDLHLIPAQTTTTQPGG
jgi:hypothetical protein